MARIAPPRLLDREADLAELAAFCLQAHRGSYAWWRAGPWAGKSALMSTFVLNPPPQLAGHVWLVSFFITARLAAQDTRTAFTAMVTEQLCELLGQELPTGAGEEAQESIFLDLLSQAAAACQAAGGRLVLVVDGLDEDRSVTVGPDAHSIAGLLPGNPPSGMRVIVAGRPNPPIPDDVPSWHPLCDPGVIRLLADSPHARDLQRMGQSELKRLLKGSPAERSLLGLLTAARGGLSGHDLNELTGASLVEIEDVLHTVVGRTFTRRAGQWTHDADLEVYLLGHEELHKASCHYLGTAALAAYRATLHDWADTYRVAGDGRKAWPPDTPEYLLTGYPRMLITEGDGDRLLALTSDMDRHDRMLDLSGGDAAALIEIKTCQDLFLASPDLSALTRLCVHRNKLESRNANIPTELPGLWVALGQPVRADALARGIPDPDRQEQALLCIAQVLTRTGDLDRAEQIARELTRPHRRVMALAGLATALHAAGDHEGAVQLTAEASRTSLDNTSPGNSQDALICLGRALIALGEFDNAQIVVHRLDSSLGSDSSQWEKLLVLLRALVAAGERERAERIANSLGLLRDRVEAGEYEEAVQLTDDAGYPHYGGDRMLDAAREAALAGEHDRARSIVRKARRQLEMLTDEYGDYSSSDFMISEQQKLADLEAALERPGDSEQLARSLFDPARRAIALVRLAGSTGDPDRAERLANEAEQIARSARYEQPLVGLVPELASIGQAERAERIARGFADADQRVRALMELAEASAAIDVAWAKRLAAETEQAAREITRDYLQVQSLTSLAQALAAIGEHDRAERIALDIAATDNRVQALTSVARALASAGEPAQAERVTSHIARPYQRDWAWAEVTSTLAHSGRHEVAERIAREITFPEHQVRALTRVALAVVATGDRVTARRLAIDAESAMVAVTDPQQLLRAQAEVAGALAGAGETDRAEEVLQAIHNRDSQTWARMELALSLTACGEHAGAERVARTIPMPYQRALTLVGLARTLMAAGAHDEAERIARDIGLPHQRAQIMAELSCAVAAAGRHADARRLVAESEPSLRASTDAEPLARALTTLAKAMFATGEQAEAARLVADAELAIGGIFDDRRHAAPLTELAVVLAAAGARAQAEKMARGLANGDERAQALTKLAEAVGQPDADRLLAEVLATSSWVPVLPGLVKIHPELVVQLADQVYAANHPQV
ncbi:hypothetical protein [Lentzea sp. NPDC051838]|uniref:hypothetical protein n=1 Tax=Lentzea sp. NPDC051838 TaxID=3154849 RepID=UPI003444951C